MYVFVCMCPVIESLHWPTIYLCPTTVRVTCVAFSLAHCARYPIPPHSVPHAAPTGTSRYCARSCKIATSEAAVAPYNSQRGKTYPVEFPRRLLILQANFFGKKQTPLQGWKNLSRADFLVSISDFPNARRFSHTHRP